LSPVDRYRLPWLSNAMPPPSWALISRWEKNSSRTFSSRIVLVNSSNRTRERRFTPVVRGE
jgi:hypothetical protein